jgi:surfactin synthase thioesterase subunit
VTLEHQLGALGSVRPLDGEWIRVHEPVPGARIRVLCFPHAGGSASYFHPLSRALAGAGVEVLAVQYPGRQDRRAQPPVDRIGPLADGVAAAVRGALGEGPTVFLGHSMGAVVAFEVALRVERDGADEPPALLVVSGRRAPSVPAGSSVHGLSDAGMIRELKRLSGTATALFDEPELVQAILPAVRADYAAIENYRCAEGTMVRCPVQAYLGDADPLATPAQVERWREHTASGFDLRTFPGGHFYLDGWPVALVSALRARLERL